MWYAYTHAVMVQIIAMHEFFPGHYQQSLLAQTHVRPLRRWFVAPTLYEGWGLYVSRDSIISV